MTMIADRLPPGGAAVESAPPPYSLDLGTAALSRFPGVESLSLELHGRSGSIETWIVLPPGYAKSRRRRYPLVIMPGAADILGSAIEMSRVMAATREVGQCILALTAPVRDVLAVTDELLRLCSTRYRIQADDVAVYGQGRAGSALACGFLAGWQGIRRCIVAALPQGSAALLRDWKADAGAGGPLLAWTEAAPPPGLAAGDPRLALNLLPEASTAALAVPALVHGLRAFWGTGHAYGGEFTALGSPLALGICRLLSPLSGALWPRASPAVASGPQLIRSRVMGRDFEVFVSLPASYVAGHPRRYPLLLSLDANSSFSGVAETAAMLARAGVTEELIVVGVGGPRAQGDIEFGFRRFEELSPPLESYRFDDPLGRFFRSLFSLRGQDARRQLGLAPQFHEFLVEELLPRLRQGLPIDPAGLGLLGHSAAGAFVGYAIAQPGSPFRRYIGLSPGTAISGHWMMRQGLAAAPPAADARVFLAIGGMENDNRFNGMAGIPATREYAARLATQAAGRVEYHCLDRESHSTVFPRAVAQALAALYPRA